MEIVIAVAEKLAEYVVLPFWQRFTYAFHYRSNLERLTSQVTRLGDRKIGLERRLDAATNNLETIDPEVESWLCRVNKIMQEKDMSFGQEGIPDPRCFNGRCPNLKSRHRLSKRAKEMTLAVEMLLEEGNFQRVSYPASLQQIGFASTEATSELHEQGTSSGIVTINPALPQEPLGLELVYKLPYTKEVLGALHDDKINTIGICGAFGEEEAVTTKEFKRRVGHLFEGVVMTVASSNPDFARIQGEIAEMLGLQLEEGSLLERAEKLSVAMTWDSKRFLVILADVWNTRVLTALGIAHAGRSKACKIILMSQRVHAFKEIRDQSDFKLILGGMFIRKPIAFESRNLIFRDVMDAINDDQINPVVVCGLGGIGKTTMIKEVGERAKASGLFDEVVMAVVSKTPELQRIQTEIAVFLGLKLTEQSLLGRAGQLHERLSTGKRFLVILEDVWTRLDLNEVGIPFGKGCKILVSSRNKNIFDEKGTKKNFILGVLKDGEPWSLFKEMAGEYIESHELRPIAQQVLNECAGLPIAISTVGRALRNREKHVWNDALRQLRKSWPDHIQDMTKEVYKNIRFSYELLGSEEAKSLFLLCCLEPEGRNILVEDLTRWGLGLGLLKDIDSVVDGRNSVETLVDILKNCFLLLDGTKAWCVKMHDVVRDVALSIVSEDTHGFLVKHGLELKDWPMEVDDKKLYTTRTLITSKSRGLDNRRYNTKAELLLLECLEDPQEPPNTIFNGMEELKVLDVRKTNMVSIPAPLLKGLQMLCLEDCRLETLAIIGELRTLQILRLRDSHVTELPSEIGNLTNLRLLDLTGCIRLAIIPPGVISSLAQLEELYMRDCFPSWTGSEFDNREEPSVRDCFPSWTGSEFDNREELSVIDSVPFSGGLSPSLILGSKFDDRVKDSVINSGLLSLRRLTTLEIALPPIPEFLHNSFLFQKLERFKISVKRTRISQNDSWNVNPCENELRLDLSDSDLSDSVYRTFGSEIMALQKRAETMDLCEVHLREALIVSGGLKSLTLKKCSGLAYLVDTTMVAQSSVFPVLHSLEIHSSQSLTEICRGQLPMGSFKELREVSLSNLSSLTHLWRTPTKCQCLENLRRVRMINCDSIQCLFLLSTSNLEQLEELDVDNCAKLEQIVVMEEPGRVGETNEIKFPSLIHLKINNLANFVGIAKSASKISFPRLFTLKIEKLPQLVSLCPNNLVPESTSTVDTVQYLLNRQVNSFGQLRFMVVQDCEKLSCVFSSNLMQNLQNLEQLEVTKCRSLKILFDFDGVDIKEKHAAETLFCLEKMELTDLPALAYVWNPPQKILAFQNLRILLVLRCPRLRNVFPAFIAEVLVKLESIYISDCELLQEFIAKNEGVESGERALTTIVFPQVKTIHLATLPYFTSFCPSPCTIEWPSLKTLVLSCPIMKTFIPSSVTATDNQLLPRMFSEKVHFPVLETLEIHQKRYLEEIWSDQLLPGSFCDLKDLHVSHCPRLLLMFPFNMQNRLQKLERLTVDVCHSLKQVFESRGFNESEGHGHVARIPRSSETQGFQNLTRIQISECWMLKNLLPYSVAKGLVKLKSLSVKSCEKMEEIVVKPAEGEETGDDKSLLSQLTTVIFPQVETIHLATLPYFTSFCRSPCTIDWPSLKTLVLSCLRMKTFIPSSVTAVDKQLLSHMFNEKVHFPVLETLELKQMDYLEEIWSDQILPGSFCDLKDLQVSNCAHLLLMFPFNMQSILQKLEKLNVTKCDSLEQVFESRGFNEGEGHVDAVRIPRSSETQGFQNLTLIKILNCHSLKNLLPYSIAKGLVKLKTLLVEFCNNMEEIVVKPAEGEDTVEDKSLLPQLSCLTLSDLPTLASFSQGKVNSFAQLQFLVVDNCEKLSRMFSSNLMQNLQNLVELKVRHCRSLKTLFDFDGVDVKEMDAAETLSCLEKMELTDLPCLADVWKPPQNILAFRNLKSLHVARCGSLRNVFPAFIAELLVKLESIYISDCDMLKEFIAKNEGGESDEKALNTILFPQVKAIYLDKLPNFTSFYPSPRTIDWPTLKTFVPSSATHAEDDQLLSHMFNEKLHFPVLEKLELRQMCNLKDIWSDQILAGFFCDPKDLHVSNCAHLLLMFPFNMQRRTQKLKKLNVIACDSLEQVFESRGFNEGEGHVDVVRIPRSSETQGFQNLTSISIFLCNGLKNLLPYSIAKGLVKLNSLSVQFCEKMEEIVVTPAEGEETGDDKSLLSQLSYLNLVCLPTLASFSQGKVCFEWPLLTDVTIDICEEMKTFSLGLVTTPRLQQVSKIDGSYHPWMGDLNSTIQHLFNERPGTSDH